MAAHSRGAGLALPSPCGPPWRQPAMVPTSSWGRGGGGDGRSPGGALRPTAPHTAAMGPVLGVSTKQRAESQPGGQPEKVVEAIPREQLGGRAPSPEVQTPLTGNRCPQAWQAHSFPAPVWEAQHPRKAEEGTGG